MPGRSRTSLDTCCGTSDQKKSTGQKKGKLTPSPKPVKKTPIRKAKTTAKKADKAVKPKPKPTTKTAANKKGSSCSGGKCYYSSSDESSSEGCDCCCDCRCNCCCGC